MTKKKCWIHWIEKLHNKWYQIWIQQTWLGLLIFWSRMLLNIVWLAVWYRILLGKPMKYWWFYSRECNISLGFCKHVGLFAKTVSKIVTPYRCVSLVLDSFSRSILRLALAVKFIMSLIYATPFRNMNGGEWDSAVFNSLCHSNKLSSDTVDSELEPLSKMNLNVTGE